MVVLLGHLAQSLQRRPGALGVHVVGRDGRQAAPVVDARAEKRGEVLGQIRGRLDVDLGWKQYPGDRYRPQMLLGRAGRHSLHCRPRLGKEFWTITSWT